MRNRLSRHWFCTAAPRPWLFVGLGKPGDKYKGTRHNVGFEMIDAFAESQGIAMDTVHCKAIFGQGFVGDIPVFLAKPQTYMNLSGESAFYHVLPQRLEQLVHNLYFLTKLQTGPLGAYYKLPLNRVLVVAMVSILCLLLSIILLVYSIFVVSLFHFFFFPFCCFIDFWLQFHDDMNLPCRVLRLYDKGGHGSHNGLKSVIYHFRGNREFSRLRICIGRPPGQMDPKAFLLQKFNRTARERIDDAIQEGVGALKLLLSKGLTETARSFNTDQKYKHIRFQTLPTS